MNSMLKKQMTKKELHQFYNQQRSMVGCGQNLGTRYMKSPKDYNRNREKSDIRKIILEKTDF